MASTLIPDPPVPTSPRTAIVGDVRLMGIAAIVVGLGFLPQPLLIFLLPAPDGAEYWPPDRVLAELPVRITIQAITWGLIGAALIVLAIATTRLLPSGTWVRIGTTFGVIGGSAWLAESAWRLSPLSQPAQHFATAPVDDATLGAILYLLNYAGFGWTVLGTIGAGIWLVLLGTAGTALIGRGLGAAAIVLGAAAVISVYAVPAFPVTIWLCLLLLIVLGILLLVRARAIAEIQLSKGRT